jgi:hypothetical protein
MRTVSLILLGAALVLAGTTARADSWDIQTQNDDTYPSHNELVHGSNQLHDLGVRPGPVADQDWYTITSKPWASYEATVDAASGDIGAPLMQLRSTDGSTVLATGTAIGNGFSYSLRWKNATSTAVTHRVRITSGFCTTDCGADDVYRIRAYETSYGIPRFNNATGQVTVVLIQNAAAYSITGNVYLWSANGLTQLGNSSFTLAPKALLSLDTSTLAPGVGGSITVANDGRYGDLTGKATALDPVAGFSFDTLMVPRPH